jgi:hypothetical protein
LADILHIIQFFWQDVFRKLWHSCMWKDTQSSFYPISQLLRGNSRNSSKRLPMYRYWSTKPNDLALM